MTCAAPTLDAGALFHGIVRLLEVAFRLARGCP